MFLTGGLLDISVRFGNRSFGHSFGLDPVQAAAASRRVLSKLAVATAILTTSACTQTPGPSPAGVSVLAQADSSLAIVERKANSSCPKTAVRVHKAALLAREALSNNNSAAFEQSMKALVAVAQICKIEMENCGRGSAHLGMTASEAIHTSWCFPDKTNTTETAGHIREQWIYPSRGYLYFDNGRLIAIQEEGS